MLQRVLIVVSIALTALSVAFTAEAQSGDAWVGTWKVNLAKSTYSPGPKPMTAEVVRMESPQGGLKVTIDGTDPQGKPTHVELNGKFDGKDVPAPGNPVPNSTAAFKRINTRSFEIVGKADGKPTVTTRVRVSADGKTLTATQSGTTPQGQAVTNVIVADKQ
jgi:hypothetical protein